MWWRGSRAPARSVRQPPCRRGPRRRRATEMKKLALLVLIASLGSGCAVGPNYKRPTVNVPDTYRGLTLEEAPKTEAASLCDQKWWEVFQDEQLQDLIRTDRKSTRLNSSH